MLGFKKNNNSGEEVEFQSKKIMDDLTDIYQNGDVDYTDDMGKLNKEPKSAIARFFTIFFSCSFLVIVLAIIAWVIVSRYQAEPSETGKESLSLNIECPDLISSGDEIICKIRYENKDKVTLTNLQLQMDYPEGFIFDSSSIEPEKGYYNNIFNFSDINPWEKGEIEIIGRIVGDKDSTKKMTAHITYKQNNYALEFDEYASASIKVGAAVVSVDISGQKQILFGKDLEYIVKIKNNSKQGIENLRLTVLYPDNFLSKEFSVDSDGYDDERCWWNIANLTATGEIEIKIIGVFSEDMKDDQEFNVTLEISDKQEVYNLIAKNSFVSKPVKENVKLDLILNGSTDGKAVSFGDDLSYSLIYENYGEQDLKDVRIKMSIKGYQGDKEIDLVNWESLKDENGGYVKDGVILWTNEEILKLSSFSAKEEGEIDFWLRLNDIGDIVSVIDADGGGLSIKSDAEIVVGKVEDVDVEMIIKSNEIVCDLNTNLIFSAQARYFNNDNIAVGSGPVPPKIGETTKYRIFWSIANSLHNTKEVSVKTVLPQNIEWTDRMNVDIGDLKYSEYSREIIWTISELPIKIREARADFEISVTPAEDDLNKILVLTNETFLTAIDAKTDSQIFAKSKPLTSDLEFDAIIGGKGVVE